PSLLLRDGHPRLPAYVVRPRPPESPAVQQALACADTCCGRASAHADTHDAERFAGTSAGRPNLPELRRPQRGDGRVRSPVRPTLRRVPDAAPAGGLAARPGPVDPGDAGGASGVDADPQPLRRTGAT